MKKLINLSAISTLILGMFIMSMSNANATSDVLCLEPDRECNTLGYNKTLNGCAGKSYLRCPFAEWYYCDGLASCADLGLTATSTAGCDKITKCGTDTTKFKCDTCFSGYNRSGSSCECVNVSSYTLTTDDSTASPYCTEFESAFGCSNNQTTPKTWYKCTKCNSSYPYYKKLDTANNKCVDADNKTTVCKEYCEQIGGIKYPHAQNCHVAILGPNQMIYCPKRATFEANCKYECTLN